MKICTPIKLGECNSMVNDIHEVVGCMMHVRTCNLVRQLCREKKSKIQLKHSYIYDFDPKAVQSSSAGL